MKLGGIKQWGSSFKLRSLTDTELRILQDRAQEMVNAHLPGYSDKFEIAWGRKDFLQVTAEDLLYAKHASDLLHTYHANSTDWMFGERAWCIDGVWYPLEDRDTHNRWAAEFLSNLDPRVPSHEWVTDPVAYLISMGGIKQWGWHFEVAKRTQHALRIIQQRIEKYPITMRIEVWSQDNPTPVNAITFEVLDAHSWRELTRMQ
jgi:hypothetical protein